MINGSALRSGGDDRGIRAFRFSRFHPLILVIYGDDISGVRLDEIVADMSDFKKVLKPGHPDADKQGYVMLPNVDLPIEMMSLATATRAYEANVAVLKRYQQMVETTLELLR